MEIARNISLTERENLDHGAVGLVGGEDCATENNGNRPAIPGDLMGYLLVGINLIPLLYFLLSNLSYCCTDRTRKIRNTQLHHKPTMVAPIATTPTHRPSPPPIAPSSGGDPTYEMKKVGEPLTTAARGAKESLAREKVEAVRRTQEHLDSVAWRPSSETKSDCSGDVDTIIKSFDMHDRALEKSVSKRQTRAKRRTQLRLQARAKVKRSRVLSKVPVFSSLDENSIEEIIGMMSFEAFRPRNVLCSQGETADKLFVIVSGQCTVWRNVTATQNRRASLRQRLTVLLPVGDIQRVATLGPMNFFGEGCIVRSPNGLLEKRDATVTASTNVTVLSLNCTDIEKLVDSGVLTADIIEGVRRIHQERHSATEGLI